MIEETITIYPIGQRPYYGMFGPFEIYGNPFRDDSAKKYWLMKLVLRSDEHSYWISGDEFREALAGNSLEGLQPVSTFLRGEVVKNLDPEARQAVLEAIGTWETRPANSQS
jgi:hypothetical protein